MLLHGHHEYHGRPTSYSSDHCELAHNYCLLGATNDELADFFDVAPRTIDNWIAAHLDFADAVRRGRAVATMDRALFERANTVSYPPDTQACMFWLRNRQRHYWQARAEAPPAWEPGPEAVDPLAAALDAAGESMHHAGD